jgi:hypothetical protein
LPNFGMFFKIRNGIVDNKQQTLKYVRFLFSSCTFRKHTHRSLYNLYERCQRSS